MSNWVYVKCIRCNNQRDFSNKAFELRLAKEKMDKDNFVSTYVCKKCQEKPILEKVEEKEEYVKEE